MTLLTAILGLATGTLLGLLGGGGSILAVPILVYVLKMETKAAIGTSLVIVGLASFLAACSHYRKNYVQVRTALLFAAAGAIGSYTGALGSRAIPGGIQLDMFAGIMIVVAILMLKGRPQKTAGTEHDNRHKLPIVLCAGAGAGLLTGVLGVGGGFIIVPTLTLILGLPIKEAIGTSLLVIGLNSIAGAAGYKDHLAFSGTLIPFAAGMLVAAPIAGHVAHYVKQDKLRTGFAVGLLLLSAWMLAKQILHV